MKQLTADSGRWIASKNGQNAVFSQRQLSGRFSAASIINLLNNIMHILSRNRSNLASSSNQYTRQSPMKRNWNLKRFFESVNATNDYSQKRQPLAHLDTGGSNFDRFIVSERRNDNPILDWIVGKFSKRGLDWSSGNLRLVNVQGNSILGSDLIVHDRSVEIPLKQWLYFLNSILKPSSKYT
uniref:Bm9817 n=1 Tax=Elaeophora elaphi TaxID=1147741 RepID=A0A0R3S171_9BILA